MTLEQLKENQTNLVLQRAAAKDQVEAAERALGQIGLAIKVLEEAAKAAEEPSPETE